MSQVLNNAFLKLSRRAEINDRSYLVATFVDVGPLFTLLSNRDHQILYGRRGTGKTHVLSFLADSVETTGDITIQIDMRTVGSSGGIYSDPSLPLSERATRLLIDTLSTIHDNLLQYVLENECKVDLSILGPLLDRFAESISEILVVGPVEREETITDKHSIGDTANMGFSFNNSIFQTNFGLGSKDEYQKDICRRNTRSGLERHRVHFGSVRNALSNITKQLSSKRIWVMLDEWSEIPLDLQPYLADLLRRSIFPVAGITVKIAAIEQRCNFRISLDNAGYIGIEVGADAATSLNLDEFMVFDNDAERAKEFFCQLLFKHTRPIIDNTPDLPNSAVDLIRHAFTQKNAFDEFVRAAEGVPRDAINIIGLAAQKARDNAISIPDIRVASKTWYNRAKETAVQAKPQAHTLLRWIIDEVIDHRQARAFLLRSDVRHELIDFLFDSRILHVVKQNISGHDEPGVRYNVYSIDYGCYVDLINTSKAPQGLFSVDTEEEIIFIDVPANDYRSIRRAILDIEKFEELNTKNY